MMSVKEIMEWLESMTDDVQVGIDDGGLCLRTVEENPVDAAWLEIGGIPGEEEEE